MSGLARPSEADAIRSLARKLNSLGLEGQAELQAVLGLLTARVEKARGEEITGVGTSPTHLTVLLYGIACSYERLEDGGRQIHTFQYPGDFCDLQRYVLPAPGEALEVGALTNCSIATIPYRGLERTIERYPMVGLALWRASMLEASILRQHLLISRRPALERVADLLCEQLARREAIGINSSVIPLTQIDLADAAGLSVVHINRVFQELRKLGILSDNGRAIEVVNRNGLRNVAGFDGRYLDMPRLLSRWQLRIENGAD